MSKVNEIKSSFDCDLLLSPVFHECTKEIEEAKEKMVEVELLEQNAENYIYEYFEDFKRQVDIRREDLKFKIDNHSDEIIKSLELNQKNLIQISKEVTQMTIVIEKSKNELNKLITQFDTLEIIINKENKQFKAVCTNSEYAIHCDPSCGPYFGRCDIRIMDSSNANRNSFSNFGAYYEHADYQCATQKAKTILAGSHYFQTQEIEVFVAAN